MDSLKTFHTLFYSSEELFLLDNFTGQLGQKLLFAQWNLTGVTKSDS